MFICVIVDCCLHCYALLEMLNNEEKGNFFSSFGYRLGERWRGMGRNITLFVYLVVKEWISDVFFKILSVNPVNSMSKEKEDCSVSCR